MSEYVQNAETNNKILTHEQEYIVIVGNIVGRQGPPLYIDASEYPIIITGSIQASKMIIKGKHRVLICGGINTMLDIEIEPDIEISQSLQTAYGNIVCHGNLKVGKTISCHSILSDADIVAANLYIKTNIRANNIYVIDKCKISGNTDAKLHLMLNAKTGGS